MADPSKTADQDVQRARYEFKRRLEELRKAKGRGTELVSVFIKPDRDLGDVTAQLRSELGQAQNIKSKSTRKNVSAALESALSHLKQFRVTPDNGMVLFMGHKAVGGQQTKMVSHVIIPPQPVPINTYRCDSRFYLEPLEGMLQDEDTYGLVVIDRAECTIGMLKGKRVQILKNMQSMVPRKHTKGGQSQRRFERLIEEAAHNYFKQAGEAIDEAFLREENMKGILIGGPGHTKEYFAEKEFIHHELEKLIIGTFDVGYTDEYGIRELVENAQDALRELGLSREKDLMKRFMGELRKEGGLVEYGNEGVRKALEMGAVDTLLLSEKLRQWRVTLRNPDTGEEEERTVKDLEAFEEDLPRSDSNQEFEIVDDVDLVEDLTQIADNMGTTVEILSDQSEEGELLHNAFGGVAALLRFRVQ